MNRWLLAFFADTFRRTRSLWLTCIEHILFGQFIFTIGLGEYFRPASGRRTALASLDEILNMNKRRFFSWEQLRLGLVSGCIALLGTTVSFAATEESLTFVSGGSRITISLDPQLSQKPEEVVRWVQTAADAVTNYYHHYPVPTVLISVAPRRGQAANSGTEYEGRRIVIHLDPGATAEDLSRDWMLTHEMFHLGFPSLPRKYHYLEEGLSDYLEPLARARIGKLSERRVWQDFVDGLPQGLPKPGDGGLDGTRSWGRTYWGGCLFWLLADVDIREKTNNTRSLDDAIRAIVSAGGTGDADWSLERVISVGDGATGTNSIRRIHDWLGPKPVDPHLEELWTKLGVVRREGKVTFDETAPQAAIRRSMTAKVQASDLLRSSGP